MGGCFNRGSRTSASVRSSAVIAGTRISGGASRDRPPRSPARHRGPSRRKTSAVPLPPGTLKLYVYERPDLTLEISRDRIAIWEVRDHTPRTYVVRTEYLTAVRCTGGGQLYLEFGGILFIVLHLGQAAAEVYELVTGLLA